MPENEIVLKNRRVTSDRRLDRIPEFDPKSRRFGIAPSLPMNKPLRSYSWRSAKVLDQGVEGACVGFGWGHELLARPKVLSEVDDNYARSIYHDARRLDEWPGEDYEGTSVLAGAKAVMALGQLHEYRWGFGVRDLLMSLAYHGPAVLGLNWYTGMMTTDSEGYIRPTGRIEGGHCICAFSVSVSKERIGLLNSWGSDWGQLGVCWITFEDMGMLLAEQGEVCIPVVR